LMGGARCWARLTLDSRRRYLAVYEELRALSPPADVMHDVPTKFGAVRVYQHGPEGGVPVVLLHGFFFATNRSDAVYIGPGSRRTRRAPPKELASSAAVPP
jgi:hypothetical protein